MERMVGDLAAGVGYVVRVLVVLASWLPAIAAPSLVLYGTYLIYPPACYILAGILVFVLTQWQPNRRRR